MHRLLSALLGATALLGLATSAHAQNNYPSVGGATVPASVQEYLNSSGQAVPVTATVPLPVAPVPSSTAASGITPVVSAALESNKVICAVPCNFYSGYVTTGATAGWLLLANATSAPTAGAAAIAPIGCVLAPANQSTSISGPGGVPIVASVGLVMVFSSSGCLTNTASTTAFFSGLAK